MARFGVEPPESLKAIIMDELYKLVRKNPMAPSSESYVQHSIEFKLIKYDVDPPYHLRIGINYHGAQVQHIKVDPTSGVLIGWNPDGDALKGGRRAKMLLGGVTIFPREADEPTMNDLKVGGGDVGERYVRIEFKVRGWLGKTKNLDGGQFEKDINLLKNDRADLLVWCLSETAHRKFRGEGPDHQTSRRSSIARLSPFLLNSDRYCNDVQIKFDAELEGERFQVVTRRCTASRTSVMPHAIHYLTLVSHAARDRSRSR